MCTGSGSDSDETITGSGGDDSIHAGAGDDLIHGLGGNDTIHGNGGADEIHGGEGSDSLEGDGGNDTIDGGGDGDHIAGGEGNDQVSGGVGDDTIYGGDDQDTLSGNVGNDELHGDQGDDLVDGGAGNDLVTGGGGNDTLHGGDGDDSLRGGWDDDVIHGGAGQDTMHGDSGHDLLHGGVGDDRVLGGMGDDTLHGEAGNDTLNGGSGADHLFGGTGDDGILVGLGDTAEGGDGADTFTIDLSDGGSGTIQIIGGAGGPIDNDRIELDDGLYIVDGTLNQTLDADGNSYSGSFVLSDGSNSYTVNFSEIEAPICFLRGSTIRTKRGCLPVEALRPDDLVQTADNGFQPIAWIGSRLIRQYDTAFHERHGPILIRAGSFGMGLPDRDLFVSPQHRILISSRIAGRMFGEREVFVPARHLLGHPGVERAAHSGPIHYFHLLLEAHEVVFSNGLRTESFHPGPEAMKSLNSAAREEVITLFPEIADLETQKTRALARFVPRRNPVRNLLRRHVKNGLSLQQGRPYPSALLES
ncbi:MAG: Hint domain-containing protein [Pseudorhodobacter sp.]